MTTEEPSLARQGLDKLLREFPTRELHSFDAQLPHPIGVWEVDEHGNRTGIRPYRIWTDEMVGPWVLVTFVGGDEYAIWKQSGDVYKVGSDHAVDKNPILSVL